MDNKFEFFESLYRNNPDPWQFATSPYELNRYQRICEVISHKKHRYAFEAGCSIGVLTKKLAQLAKFVEAIDISSLATSRALIYCNELKNVRIQCDSLINYPINSKIDLIILSEIGYYFYPNEWESTLKKILLTCEPPFYLLASHWLGNSKDHVLSGDEVHSIIYSLNGLHLEHSEINENFRLDYWIRI